MCLPFSFVFVTARFGIGIDFSQIIGNFIIFTRVLESLSYRHSNHLTFSMLLLYKSWCFVDFHWLPCLAKKIWISSFSKIQRSKKNYKGKVNRFTLMMINSQPISNDATVQLSFPFHSVIKTCQLYHLIYFHYPH